MARIVRMEIHVEAARQIPGEFLRKLSQARRHQLVDLRQARAEIVNREHVEVAAQKTQRRHKYETNLTSRLGRARAPERPSPSCARRNGRAPSCPGLRLRGIAR